MLFCLELYSSLASSNSLKYNFSGRFSRKKRTGKQIYDEIINNYILPFTYFALLNNKIEKGFINSISMIEKKEG